MDTIDIIKNSFERWFNGHIAEVKTSIAISYSDTQELALKAYHKAKVKVDAITIEGDKANTRELLLIEETYNHGVTSEEEIKEKVLVKLLETMYNYPL